MALASVILSNYNGAGIADTIRRNVAAVLAQTYPDLELILVDDGSSDASPELLRTLAESDARVQFVAGPHRGIPAARNLGIGRARGAYLAFLDNDAVPETGWLAMLVARLESDPTVGACASRVMFHDKPDIVNSLGSVLNRLGHGMDVGMHELVAFMVPPAELMYATGNGLALRREVLERVGLFDEGFRFYGHDDSDMGVRLRAAGYRVVPEPRAVVRHIHSYSKTQPGMRFWDDRNRLRFMLKHYQWRELAPCLLADARGSLRAPYWRGYVKSWLSNLGDLGPVLSYRRAHQRQGSFLARQSRFMQGEHGYLLKPDNRGLGQGFPALTRLTMGQDDEPFLYHGWYWVEHPNGTPAFRWGRRVSSLVFSREAPADGLTLAVVTPPGAGGGALEAWLQRREDEGWQEAGRMEWRLPAQDFARAELRWKQPVPAGRYRLVLVAERVHRDGGDFPRELGIGLEAACVFCS